MEHHIRQRRHPGIRHSRQLRLTWDLKGRAPPWAEYPVQATTSKPSDPVALALYPESTGVGAGFVEEKSVNVKLNTSVARNLHSEN